MIKFAKKGPLVHLGPGAVAPVSPPSRRPWVLFGCGKLCLFSSKWKVCDMFLARGTDESNPRTISTIAIRPHFHILNLRGKVCHKETPKAIHMLCRLCQSV